MNISDEAVLAGAAAIQVRLDKSVGLNDLVRAVLEAASPHLMSEAWEEGHLAATEATYELQRTNPYRSAGAAE